MLILAKVKNQKVKKGKPPKKYQIKKNDLGGKFPNRVWSTDQEKHKGPKI